MNRTLVFSFLFTLFISHAHAQWTPVANMPIVTSGSFSWVIGNRVFVSGGYGTGIGPFGTNYTGKRFYEYDVATDQWNYKGAMGGNFSHFGAFTFVANNKGYVIAGDSVSISKPPALPTATGIWEYDPANNQWAHKGDFPGGKRRGGFCFVINNIAYMGGGEIGDGATYINDIWKYDPANGVWANLGTTPAGAPGGPSFSLNGKGYIAGSQNSWWEFTPQGTWTQKQDIPYHILDSGMFGTAFTIGNFGYYGGGYRSSGITRDIWRYNPVLDEWSAVTKMPGNYTIGPISFVVGTTCYIGGGGNYFTQSPSNVYVTDSFYKHQDLLDIPENSYHAVPLNIYPNPVNEVLYLSGQGLKDADIMIYDAVGKTVYHAHSSSAYMVINTAGLAPGVYHARATAAAGVVVKSFVKR